MTANRQRKVGLNPLYPTPADLVVTPSGLRFRGRRFPCVVGRGGITDRKREGDGATPRGAHALTGILYRPDRITPPTRAAIAIGPPDLWSDDPSDAAYNHLVRAPYLHSHEKLRRADPLYDLVILTDWNWPQAVRHGGSAIFVHQWRRPGYPTAGCIALSRTDLRWIAARLTPASRLIVV